MPNIYRCKYCNAGPDQGIKTPKGLHLHITQSKHCHLRLQQEVAESDDEPSVNGELEVDSEPFNNLDTAFSEETEDMDICDLNLDVTPDTLETPQLPRRN